MEYAVTRVAAGTFPPFYECRCSTAFCSVFHRSGTEWLTRPVCPVMM
jgi:hypothetical protein